MSKPIFWISALATGLLFSCGESKSSGSDIQEDIAVVDSTSIEDLSLEGINQQIVDNPGSSNGFYRRSKYNSEKGEFRNALDDIDRALQIDPEVDFLLYERAKILMSFNRFSDAILYSIKTLESNPENIDAHILLGKLHFISGDNEEAVKHLDEALKQDKFNYEPYFIKGMIFESTGSVSDTISAATSYQTAIEQNPDHFDSYFKLAALYFKRKPDLAIQYLNQAIAVNPNSLEALRTLSSLQVDIEDYNGSLNTISKMISTDAGYSESYFLKGRTYLMMLADDATQQTKDTTYQQSILFLDKAIELYPKYDMAYYLKGLCFEEMGDKGQARELYVKALDANSQNELATQALRDLY